MAVPAPSHRFGVTPADVATRYLSAMVPDTSSGALLDQCISTTSSRLLTELTRWDIVGASITEADYPDDYVWCWDTVAAGAASAYISSSAGVTDDALETDFRDRVRSIRESPQKLEIYQPETGANGAASHMTTLPANTVASLRARAGSPSPARAKQWGTL